MPQLTKPGRHGTLRLYSITYRDRSDDGCPAFKTRLWAYDYRHALDRFNDSDDTAWTVDHIEPVVVE